MWWQCFPSSSCGEHSFETILLCVLWTQALVTSWILRNAAKKTWEQNALMQYVMKYKHIPQFHYYYSEHYTWNLTLWGGPLEQVYVCFEWTTTAVGIFHHWHIEYCNVKFLLLDKRFIVIKPDKCATCSFLVRKSK